MNQKRKLFEEVSETARGDTSKLTSQRPLVKEQNNFGIRIFLGILFFLVVGMVLLGGLTRQTDSGLSMTEWHPVTGFIPPLSEEAWIEEFTKYQETSEYKLVNQTMELAEFKPIYWWEWWHRQLGRLVGMVFIIGFLALTLTKKLDTNWTKRLLMLGGLGLLQGIIGWWMVRSGLTENAVDVASYRLAVHLSLSFLILLLVSWQYSLSLQRPHELFQARRLRDKKTEFLALLFICLLFLQSILGALVAGIDAGLGFPTWPLMNGEVLPSNSFEYSPWYVNFVDNPSLVQFNHRIVAYLLFIPVVLVWYRCHRSPHKQLKLLGNVGVVLFFCQFGLGIISVLYSVPVLPALGHQILAVLLIVLYTQILFWSRYPKQLDFRS